MMHGQKNIKLYCLYFVFFCLGCYLGYSMTCYCKLVPAFRRILFLLFSGGGHLQVYTVA